MGVCKVRASLATALLRGKSNHGLYDSVWFVPCLPAVCLLLKRFFSSLARFSGSSATHTLRKNICWFFSWLVIGEGPELLDAESHSSIAPPRRGTCRRSKVKVFRPQQRTCLNQNLHLCARRTFHWLCGAFCSQNQPRVLRKRAMVSYAKDL